MESNRRDSEQNRGERDNRHELRVFARKIKFRSEIKKRALEANSTEEEGKDASEAKQKRENCTPGSLISISVYCVRMKASSFLFKRGADEIELCTACYVSGDLGFLLSKEVKKEK